MEPNGDRTSLIYPPCLACRLNLDFDLGAPCDMAGPVWAVRPRPTRPEPIRPGPLRPAGVAEHPARLAGPVRPAEPVRAAGSRLLRPAGSAGRRLQRGHGRGA